MAYYLERQKTGSTPYVLVDEDKKYMKFSGESFNENVSEFFFDVNNWLESYLKTDFSSFTFDCEMNYFNSSTAKLLINMLMMMDGYSSESNKIIVNWIADEENDIIIECGEDFKEEMNDLEFNLIVF